MNSLDEWLRWAIGGVVAGLLLLWRVINGKADRGDLQNLILELRSDRVEAQKARHELREGIHSIGLTVAEIRGELKSVAKRDE